MKIIAVERRTTKATYLVQGASKATDTAIIRKCNSDKRALCAEVVRLSNGMVECTLSYMSR